MIKFIDSIFCIVYNYYTVHNLDTRQTESLQSRQAFRLVVQLEQANLLEMPEKEFNKLITEVESDPLFRNLYRKEKVIRYQRYPRTDVSPHFYQINEEITASTGDLDVESLLSNKECVVRQIQKIGLENFRRYFLYPETGLTLKEIAKECNLKLAEVEKINNLINEFSVMSEFYHPSTISSEHGIHYSKVASIDRGPGGFIIGYLSPSYARGKYSIDYGRFDELKEEGVFSVVEAREIRKLFKRLELINNRKDTMTRILQGIVEKQELYFESGNARAILPYSQSELAEKIGLVPSSISRAISSKSLETPWGEEKAIKDFFPRPKMFKKQLLKQLLETGEQFPSDEAIKTKLEQDFGVSISRRLVANLRKELKIPAAWERERQLSKKARRE